MHLRALPRLICLVRVVKTMALIAHILNIVLKKTCFDINTNADHVGYRGATVNTLESPNRFIAITGKVRIGRDKNLL